MSNYNEEIHYDELVKENIIIAKTLANLPEEQKGKIKKLLLKKQILKQKNGFFAEYRINKINKKIEQIRKDCNEEKEEK